MRWELKHGKDHEWFLSLIEEDCDQNIKDIAIRALNAKPLLKDDLIFIWETFLLLWNGQIFLSDVKIYLDIKGITDKEEIEDYIFYLKSLEKELLKHQNKPNNTQVTYGNSNDRNKHRNK